MLSIACVATKYMRAPKELNSRPVLTVNARMRVYVFNLIFSQGPA